MGTPEKKDANEIPNAKAMKVQMTFAPKTKIATERLRDNLVLSCKYLSMDSKYLPMAMEMPMRRGLTRLLST